MQFKEKTRLTALIHCLTCKLPDPTCKVLDVTFVATLLNIVYYLGKRQNQQFSFLIRNVNVQMQARDNTGPLLVCILLSHI